MEKLLELLWAKHATIACKGFHAIELDDHFVILYLDPFAVTEFRGIGIRKDIEYIDTVDTLAQAANVITYRLEKS